MAPTVGNQIDTNIYDRPAGLHILLLKRGQDESSLEEAAARITRVLHDYLSQDDSNLEEISLFAGEEQEAQQAKPTDAEKTFVKLGGFGGAHAQPNTRFDAKTSDPTLLWIAELLISDTSLEMVSKDNTWFGFADTLGDERRYGIFVRTTKPLEEPDTEFLLSLAPYIHASLSQSSTEPPLVDPLKQAQSVTLARVHSSEHPADANDWLRVHDQLRKNDIPSIVLMLIGGVLIAVPTIDHLAHTWFPQTAQEDTDGNDLNKEQQEQTTAPTQDHDAADVSGQYSSSMMSHVPSKRDVAEPAPTAWLLLTLTPLGALMIILAWKQLSRGTEREWRPPRTRSFDGRASSVGNR